MKIEIVATPISNLIDDFFEGERFRMMSALKVDQCLFNRIIQGGC